MNKTLKKALSIILTILMIATTTPMAFAEGDDAPLTIDMNGVTSSIIQIGNGYTYYDEDGYIITGTNKDVQIIVQEDCDITFNNMSAKSIKIWSSVKNVTVTLNGDNSLEGVFDIGSSHLTINGDADDTLNYKGSTYAFTTYGSPGILTVNGGKINAVTETTSNFPTIWCSGGFILNGGEFTVSNNKYYVIQNKTIINGGTLNVISTSSNYEAFIGDIEIAKGALLTASATYELFYTYYNITLVNESEENLSVFAKFDTSSDFAPFYDINAVIEDKTYAEIKVDTHEHNIDNSGKCADCGADCPHENIIDGKCDACGTDCPHKNITDGTCNDCGTEGKFVTITMNDHFGDGWTGNAVKIEKLADGVYTEVATATLEDGENGTFTAVLPEDCIYALRWIVGRHPNECSFAVTVNGEIVYVVTNCLEIVGGQLVYVICDHSFEGEICTQCGLDCGVDFEHSITDNSCTICGKYMYAITHQPTTAAPYVKINNDTDASYQWYTSVNVTVEITDENAQAFDPAWIGSSDEMFMTTAAYSDATGWSPAILSEDSISIYFCIELKAGETISLEFSSAPDSAAITDVWFNNGTALIMDGTKTSYTAEADGKYMLIALTYTEDITTVKAYTEGKIYIADEGQTAATLFPTALGLYACEVTYGDGTREMSETFEATTIHTCDLIGEWKSDSEKHWKECACGKIVEEANNHNFEDYTVTTPADCENNAWETGYCSCGATDEREVPESALGHTPSVRLAMNETEHWRYCANDFCGEEIEGTRTAHKYENYTVTTPADCENNAEETGSCGCGATHTGEVENSALGHDDKDDDYLCDNDCGHEFEQPVTPDEPAEDTCDRCGEVHTNFFQNFICMIRDFFNRIISFFTGLFK